MLCVLSCDAESFCNFVCGFVSLPVKVTPSCMDPFCELSVVMVDVRELPSKNPVHELSSMISFFLKIEIRSFSVGDREELGFFGADVGQLVLLFVQCC